MAQYQDTIIQKYLELIKSKAGGIKNFYNGTLYSIPLSNLPLVMIDVENTEVSEFSTNEDKHILSLVLTFIADMRKDTSTVQLMESGFGKVLDFLVGRSSDYSLKENSILYILRNNLNVDVANNLRTDVGSITIATPREVATGRMPGYWSAEGTIRFKAHFIQTR